jgi:catechol 2,3-dioxygenase-like lactoylglutathione lyase family enzyme
MNQLRALQIFLIRSAVSCTSRTRHYSDQWRGIDYKGCGEMKQESSVMIEGISAVTLGTHEMPRTVRFYRALGFEVLHGGEESSFTSFRAGASYLNVIAQPAERRWSWWGRVIFYVADVDALYDRALAAGYRPATVPHDAEWGERFFHLIDPDGHELSFARPFLPVSVQ